MSQSGAQPSFPCLPTFAFDLHTPSGLPVHFTQEHMRCLGDLQQRGIDAK